jgi:hypothetical protein
MAQTRILDSDHALLQELAASTGKPHQEIIHEALKAFHRDRMLDEINAADNPACAQRLFCPSTRSTTARQRS